LKGSKRPVVVVARVDRPPPGLPEVETGAIYQFASDEGHIRDALTEAEALFAWNFSDEPWFRRTFVHARHLRWIHTAGVGIDPILFREVVDSPVIITNSGGVYERTMAEYALMLMLQMAKDAVRTHEDQTRHVWNRRKTDTLQGRVLVIVGAGSIGTAIARLSRAFGMTPLGVARTARPGGTDFDAVYASHDLISVVGRADYVVLTVPLTPSTMGLFDREAVAHMKTSARIINLGRGALLDETALMDALAQGKIAGAALDVFHEEPLPISHPLWDLPNVFVSPHMSGDVFNTHERFVAGFVSNLWHWVRGEPLEYVVDKSLGFRSHRIDTIGFPDARGTADA
jgi:phosphoglycerate dehydrogenase-like enzyme